MGTDLKSHIKLGTTKFQGQYLVKAYLFDFSQGAVYKGEDSEDEAECYLKVYYDFELKDAGTFTTLEEEIEAFDELGLEYMQGGLEVIRADCPGINYIFPVVVMEVPDGKPCRTVMKADVDGCLVQKHALEVVTSLASDFEKMVEAELSIEDFSPDRIFLSDVKGEDKVTYLAPPYFPSVEVCEFESKSQQKFYAAPELFDDEEAFSSSQVVYGLACLLHELLEGTPPYLDEDQEKGHKEGVHYGLKGISKGTEKLLLQCLAKSPEERPELGGFSKKLKKSSSGGPLIPVLLILLLLGGGVFYGMSMMGSSKKKKPRKVVTKQKEGPKIRKVKKEVYPEDIEGMIYIQESFFTMGAADCNQDCSTEHEVTLSPFYMDITEVTNEEFEEFVNTTEESPPNNTRPQYNLWKDGAVPEEIRRQPVINVSYFQAESYCMSVGKRLPTEAEWEFAARGSDGRLYPWGDMRPSPKIAQFDGEWRDEKTLYEVNFFDDGRTPEGIYNMFGGVKEWVSDWYDPEYYTSSPDTDPQGPDEGEKRVVRGTSWEGLDEPLTTRDALAPNAQLETVGFRCAKTWEEPEAEYMWVDEKGNEVDPPEDAQGE